MRNRIFERTNCPSTEELRALDAEELPSSRIVELKSHIGECARCAGIFESLEKQFCAELRNAASFPLEEQPGWAAQVCGDLSSPDDSVTDVRSNEHIFERNGRYQSRGSIDFGGMGEVYHAWEKDLKRSVAIKIPSRERLSRNLIDRFLKEAPLQAQLEHPNIVRIYSSDAVNGIPYFVMELVKGETLSQALTRSPIPPRRAADLLRQIATAVHYAHEMGVFHRDLKPRNIMLTTDGVPKIVDFGLARTIHEHGDQSSGRGAGTPEYMAPEQWEEEPEAAELRMALYRRTDVYGLGAVLYEVLTGCPPFPPGEEPEKTRKKVRFDEPPLPRSLRPSIPRDLEKICLRCLEKRPEDRYATAEEVAVDLWNFLNGFPRRGDGSWFTHARYFVRRHRWFTSTASAAVVLIAALVAFNISTSRMHRVDKARNEFEAGQWNIEKGYISLGLDQVNSAIRDLPSEETKLRDYYTLYRKSLNTSLSRVIQSYTFPNEIQAAILSRDAEGRYMLLCDSTGTPILWDRFEGKVHELSDRLGSGRVSAITLDRSAKFGAVGDLDGNVTVWDLGRREVVWSRRVGDPVGGLAFVGKQNHLLMGVRGENGPTLEKWDVFFEGGRRLELEHGDGPVVSGTKFVLSPDGDRIVIVPNYSSELCQLRDSNTGRLISELSDGIESSTNPKKPSHLRAAFSEDGGRLIVAGENVSIYDGYTGSMIQPVRAGSWKQVQSVTVGEDGVALLLVDGNDATVLRRLRPDFEAWVDLPIDRFTALLPQSELTPQDYVLTGMTTRKIQLLQPPQERLLGADIGQKVGIADTVTYGTGSNVAVLIRPEKTRTPRTDKEVLEAVSSMIYFWEAGSMMPVGWEDPIPEGVVPTSIAYGAGADLFAIGCLDVYDNPAQVYVAKRGFHRTFKLTPLGTHTNVVGVLVFTPDGRTLITASAASSPDGKAELKGWSVEQGGRLLWEQTYPATIRHVVVSPEGQRILVIDANQKAQLLRLDDPTVSPELLIEKSLAPNKVLSVVFAHTKPLIAIAQSDGHISILNISHDSFDLLAKKQYPQANFTDIAFSDDDQLIYIGVSHGIQRMHVPSLERIDPEIRFSDELKAFSLISQSEAVVAITRNGKLIERPIPRLDIED